MCFNKHTMRIIAYIILIYSFTVNNVKGQDIKSITQTSFGELVVEAKSKIEFKRKLRKMKSYPEFFDLYFDSKSISKFDKQGNLISKSEFKENGEINSIAIYEYSDSNEPIKEIYTYPSRPKSNRIVNYIYNFKGKLIQFTDSTLNYIQQREITYPSMTSKQSVLMINNEFADKWITKSDLVKRYAMTTGYDKNDSVFAQIKRWYNKNEQIIKQIDINSKGEPVLTRFFRYDNEGNKIYESDEMHNSSRIVERHWLYEIKDNSIEFKSYINGNLDQFTKSYYDEHGNEIKTEFYETEIITSITSSEFEYDENGNWTVKKNFWDGEIKSITKRQVEYYK